MIKVSVGADKKWLRLRWKENGQYRILYPGCENNSEGLRTSKRIALQMEEDWEKNNFDFSLNKYRIKTQNQRQSKTLGDLCNDWIDATKKHLDPRSIKAYTSHLNVLSETGILDLNPEQITVNEAYKVVSEFKSKGLKLQTIKMRIFLLSATWEWANNCGILERKNPFRQLKFEAETQKIDPFSKDEVQRIIKASPPSHKNFIKFLFISGCRIGEGFGLQWADLSPDCGMVTINQQWTQNKFKPLKKGGKPRTFHLPPAFAAELQALPRTSNFVFGEPPELQTFRKIWIKILEKADVRYRRPYNCRHTFVCHRLQEGWKPTKIVQITGHTLETMFKHYATFLAEEIQLPDL